MIHCDVLVAGLGVMGSAAADRLARRGVSVIAIDPLAPGHDQGSSHGETRNIRQAIYESPAYVPLLLRAFDLWHALADETGRELVRLTGRVMIGRPDGRSLAGAADSARLHGLPLEELTPEEIRRRWPAFQPDDDMIGLYEARAGMLFAERCVRAQVESARRHGGVIRTGEQLLDWRPDGGGVVVRTSAAEYAASHLVLAVGPWLPEVMPTAPVSIERQVLLWFEPRGDREVFSPDRFPIYLWELGPDLALYGVPYWGDGLKVARHHGGEVCTVGTVRREVDDADHAAVHGPLTRHLPAAAGRFLRGKVCLYTNTPDRHFVIDHHPDSDRVTVLSPCSGHGFKFAPAIGEAAAELAIDGRTNLDLSFFRFDRRPTAVGP